MNVKYCTEVRNPGDWCFFIDSTSGQAFIKIIIPVPEISNLPEWHAGDPRLMQLPVNGANGWQWNGNEDAPTVEPSIKTEIVVGHTADNPPKPILREVLHGHLTDGVWKDA